MKNPLAHLVTRFTLMYIVTRKQLKNKSIDLLDLEIKFKKIKAAFLREDKKYGYKLLDEDINLTILFWKQLLEGYQKKKDFLKCFEIINSIIDFIKIGHG